MQGGTTYQFVTDGIESALAHAKEAAGGKDVMVWGGGDIVGQYLAARTSSNRSRPSRRPASPTSSTEW